MPDHAVSSPQTSALADDLLDLLPPDISQKQEQILQGAMRVFLQSGFAGTSMDRVAAEAGVSKQTIYSHFQDKEGLFKALMERATLVRFKGVICLNDFSVEPATLLRQLAETYLTKVATQDYLSLIRVIVGESERFPELAQLFIRTVVQRGKHLLGQYLAAHPELGLTDPEATAQIFFGSLVSFVLCQEILHGNAIMPMDRDRLIDTLIDLVLGAQPPKA